MSQNEFIFDIDMDDVFNIQRMLKADNKQVRLSMSRALRRTSKTIQSRSIKYLKDSLQARKAKKVRTRFKFYINKSTKHELGEYKFWFGLNDLTISDLKGSVKKLGTKKQSAGGTFNPKSSILLSKSYKDKAFVARINGKKSIFIRQSKKRYPIKEATIPIADEVQDGLDDILWDMHDIFLHHFEVDLKGRKKMGSKIKNSRGRK